MKPELFVSVRHGHAEHNEARSRSRRNDHSLYQTEFGKRSNAKCRLTSRGRLELRVAGKWIKTNIEPCHFDRYYCSYFTRAMESAVEMDLPDALWSPEHILREQDSGIFCTISEEDRRLIKEATPVHHLDSPFLFRPEGSESQADMVTNRVERFSDRLSNKGYPRVISVNHGRLMDGFRFRFCHWTIEEWEERDRQRLDRYDIGNGQIHMYTRRHPQTRELINHFGWFKSVRPTDLEHPSNTTVWTDDGIINGWVPIVLRRFTNAELRAMVEKVPQLVDVAPATS